MPIFKKPNFRNMKRKLFTTVALLCLFAVCMAAATGIAGSWTGTLKTPDGNEFPLNYTFKTDNGVLTGTAQSPEGMVDIIEAKMKQDSLNFGVMVNDVKAIHSAKYFAAGDSISLNIDFNGEKLHTTLTRAK